MQSVKIAWIFFVLTLALFSQAMAQRSVWQTAEVVFKDGRRVEGFVRYRESAYFAYMKFKNSIETKPYVISPYDVSRVSMLGEQQDYFVSISLPEKDHFVEATYFARYVAGDEISLLKTRFFYRTCSCNSRGSYRYGWFLSTPDSLYFVNTDKNSAIINHIEIDSCLNHHQYRSLIPGGKTFNDLLNILSDGHVLFAPENRGKDN